MNPEGRLIPLPRGEGREGRVARLPVRSVARGRSRKDGGPTKATALTLHPKGARGLGRLALVAGS